MNNQLTPRINQNERNVVYDGAMDFWPNGTSINVANNSGAYGASLIKNFNLNTGTTLNSSRSTTVPNNQFSYAARLSKTVAGTLASGTSAHHDYNIEGYDVQRIFNTEFTVLFWVRCSVAGNRPISIRNGAATHSYVKTYNIAQANTYELKAVKFDALNTCPGLISRDAGLGLYVTHSVVAGSALQTNTLNQWVTGNLISTSGIDTTWLTGTNHDFYITGLMILPGDWTSIQNNPSAYTFVRSSASMTIEETSIARYIELSATLYAGPCTSANAYSSFQTYRVAKRAIPSITLSNIGSNGFPAASGIVTNVSSVYFTEQRTANATLVSSFFFSNYIADARF